MAKNKWQKQDEAEGFEDVPEEEFLTEEQTEDVDVFEAEDLEEFGELVAEGGEIDVVAEEDEEPSEEPKEEETFTRARVTSLNAFVYPDTDVFTKPVARVSRGNLLSVLGDVADDRGDIWYQVAFTNQHGKQEGFIQKQRIQMI